VGSRSSCSPINGPKIVAQKRCRHAPARAVTEPPLVVRARQCRTSAAGPTSASGLKRKSIIDLFRESAWHHDYWVVFIKRISDPDIQIGSI
jgi:hypothetical protein